MKSKILYLTQKVTCNILPTKKIPLELKNFTPTNCPVTTSERNIPNFTSTKRIIRLNSSYSRKTNKPQLQDESPFWLSRQNPGGRWIVITEVKPNETRRPWFTSSDQVLLLKGIWQKVLSVILPVYESEGTGRVFTLRSSVSNRESVSSLYRDNLFKLSLSLF